MNEQICQTRKWWLLSMPLLISVGVVGCIGIRDLKSREEVPLTIVEFNLKSEHILQATPNLEQEDIEDGIQGLIDEVGQESVKEEQEESLVSPEIEERPSLNEEGETSIVPPKQEDSSFPEVPKEEGITPTPPPVVDNEMEEDVEVEEEEAPDKENVVIVPPQIEIEEVGKQLKVTITHELYTGSEEEKLQYRIDNQDWEVYEAPFYLPIADYIIESQLVLGEKNSTPVKEEVLLKLPVLEAPKIEVVQEKYQAEVILTHPRFEGLSEEVIEYRIDDQEWQQYENPFDWLTEWQSLEVRYREGSRLSEVKRETIAFEHPICERGNTTEENPCVITTPEQLNALQLYVNEEQLETFGKYYELGDDIDLTGFDNDNDPSNGNWNPIGSDIVSFKGNFDGNNYVISNLTIIRPNDDNVGFFGKMINSSISNLKMDSVYLEGNEAVGGLIGFAEASIIKNVVLKGEVKGNDSKIGGIIGRTISKSTLSNLSFSGRVEGSENSSRVGGVVGHHAEGSILRNSFSDATVFAGSNVGGLVGFSNSSFVEESYATGDVSAKSGVVGGLVGQAWGPGEVRRSFATGSVSTREGGSLGGLIGWVNASSIHDTYSTGTVSGQSTPIGGLIGGANSGAVIENSYSIGKVFGTNGSGFIGSTTTTIEVNKGVYWDVQTSEQPNSVAGVGLNTSQMTGFNALKHMEGFDFEDTWQFCQGDYPQLKIFATCTLLQTGYAGGSGAEDDPYLISNEQQLDWLRFEVNELNRDTANVYYELINTIDLSAYDSDGIRENGNWTPLKAFKGHFNGGGHSIENLKVATPNSNDVGLFGDLEDASIKNIYLTKVCLEGNDRVGGLVGYTANSEISQVSVQGTVSGKYRVGGIVGSSYSSHTKESFSDVLVTNTGARTGGIVGSSWEGVISNSFSQATVSGKQHTGGVVGYNASNSKVENSLNIGVVLGEGQKGGLAGYNTGSTVSNSYWNTESALISTTIGEGVGLTTAQMTGFNTLKYIENFDFEKTWQLCQGGYPQLKIFATCTPLQTGYAGGTGTEEDPYLVETPEQLNWLRVQTNLDAVKYTRGKYFKLITDIDLTTFDIDDDESNGNWIPIGTNAQRFQGIFDGDGHAIENVSVIQPTMDFVGLFGRMGTAQIKNVSLESSRFEGNNYVGSLVGYVYYNCSISDVAVDAAVKGNGYVGGLIGVNYSNVNRAIVNVLIEGVDFNLIGVNYGDLTAIYYNKELSTGVSKVGIGLTTSQMTGVNAIKYMEGFDFKDTWQACEGDYPQLKIFATCMPASQPKEIQEEILLSEEKELLFGEIEENNYFEVTHSEEDNQELSEVNFDESQEQLFIAMEEEIVFEFEELKFLEDDFLLIEEIEDYLLKEEEDLSELSEEIRLQKLEDENLIME